MMKYLMILEAVRQFWSLFIAAVAVVEQALPDDATGTQKFDLWLKTILKWNSGLEKFKPVMPELAAAAKEAYKAVGDVSKLLKNDVPADPK
jgi:hypothetical protein